ncbi:hypothetical protein F4677DRAFT_2011 [Hypoxylon crocopeplum]|nr:hypothetical protein F4677DRAFT_2011 [Hypoxylon crocopeplum]
MGKLSPVDPRGYLPSRAHPEHRSTRKELEKQHPFGWTEPLILGMLGVGLAWNIEKQVKKHEDRKDREEREREERDERRRRRREAQIRNGSFDPFGKDKDRGSSRAEGSDRGIGGSDRSRSVARDTVDLEKGRRSKSRRDRVQSVDVGSGDDARYLEDGRYYEQSQYDRRYDDSRTRDRGREYHSRRDRRDSW